MSLLTHSDKVMTIRTAPSIAHGDEWLSIGAIPSCRLIELPKIPDARGNLTFLEGSRHIPFAIKRVYWIYDVPGGETRGGHALKTQSEVLIAISGSFQVVLDDGQRRESVLLNRSYFGLYIPPMTWRHIEEFSTNSLCLILSSAQYEEADYIREHHAFKRRKESDHDNNR